MIVQRVLKCISGDGLADTLTNGYNKSEVTETSEIDALKRAGKGSRNYE